MDAKTRRERYGDKVLQGGRLTVEIVEKAASLSQIPYLQTAAGLVLNIFEIFEAVKSNKDEFMELAKEATKIFEVLQSRSESFVVHTSWLPNTLMTVIEDLKSTLNATIQLAENNISRGWATRILASKDDPGEIRKLRQRISSSINRFMIESQFALHQTLSELPNQVSQSNVVETKKAQAWRELYARIHTGAGFDAAARGDFPPCTPETRKAILKYIEDWIEDSNSSSRILWLHGAAGAGKTSIGQSIALRYRQYKRLLASFFFSRTGGDARPHTKIHFVTTIAFQLCISIPDLMNYVADAIHEDRGIFDRDLPSQMQSLIIDPLCQLLRDRPFHNLFPNHWWFLLIDGLDECAGEAAQKEVLSVLLMLVQNTNLPLRVLVASRPEHTIHTFMNSSMGLPNVRSLPLAVDYDADEDIKIHLFSEFNAIKRTHPASRNLPAEWPCYKDVQKLVARSHGLFIYASVVMNYIKSEDNHPVERLEQIIGSSDATGANSEDLPFAQLDAMYAYILLKVPTRSNRQKIRDILCLLIFRSLPTDITVYEAMFDLKPGGLRILFKPLAAVITISDASWETILFVHASFPDFLQDLSRLTSSSVPEFACVLDNDTHARFALAWLRHYANIPTAVFAHHKSNDFYPYTSIALREICLHCREANLWNVLEPALQTFDMRLSFQEDLKNKQEQWDRVHYCLDILLWIRSQEHNDTARILHDRHRQHIESALRGYWSQIPPEVQFFLPFLLLRELHIQYSGRNGMQWRLLWLSAGTAPGRLLSEIFLEFTENMPSDYPQLKGNEQVRKFVIWAAIILIEQQSKNNHPYDAFVNRNSQPGVLAVVLDSAPADLELDAFLRSSNLVHVAERKLAEPPDKYDCIHPGCKNLLRAIEDYHTKCDQLRTQLRTVESDSLPSDIPIDGSDISNAVVQLAGTSSEKKSISMTATENGDDEAVLSAADGTSDLERNTKSRKEPADVEDVNTIPVDILRPETEPTKLPADDDPVGAPPIPRIQAHAADGTRQIFVVTSLVVALLSYFGMKYIFKQR